MYLLLFLKISIFALTILGCDGGMVVNEKSEDAWLDCVSEQAIHIRPTIYEHYIDSEEFFDYQNREIWLRCLKNLPHDEELKKQLRKGLFENKYIGEYDK